MKLKLVIISEETSEIICENDIELMETTMPNFKEVLEEIGNLFPGIQNKEHYDIYWRFSRTEFWKVCDYCSYFVALCWMLVPTFYLILRDFQSSILDSINIDKLNDLEILQEILEDSKTTRYYTKSMRDTFQIVDTFKRGQILQHMWFIENVSVKPKVCWYSIEQWPGFKKEKEMLDIPNDAIINQRPVVKFKDEKKGKKDKDKKKGKKEKKDKKSKKK